jgi:hypothetical protein
VLGVELVPTCIMILSDLSLCPTTRDRSLAMDRRRCRLR